MLMRYDPFREFDRFTEGLFGNAGRTPWMPMDAFRHGDRVEIRFDLPGVRPDTIDLTIERNVLTVKAERHQWIPEEGSEVLARERTYGELSRQVLLGDALDADRLEAHYDQGVLTVRVPVTERAKSRKVEVHAGDQRTLEVGTDS
jgi:HSP20 family protein